MDFMNSEFLAGTDELRIPKNKTKMIMEHLMTSE